MTEFELTEDHLLLLRNAYVSWEDCEFGAPVIDCKRPYGNSFVEGDICEILGWESEEEDLYDDENLRAWCSRIHRELEYALQIVLQHGLQPGVYGRTDKYSSEWELLE